MYVTQNKINQSLLRDDKNRRYEHVDKVLAVSQTGTSVTLDLGFLERRNRFMLVCKVPW